MAAHKGSHLKRLVALLILALGGVVGGCGTQKDVADASLAVVRFHSQLDNADYQTILNQADQRFRDSSPEPQLVAFLTAVHTKLGKVTSASRQGFFVNYNTSGMQVRLTYTTKFEAGDAQEQFVWVRNSNDFALLGYNINSMALITK